MMAQDKTPKAAEPPREPPFALDGPGAGLDQGYFDINSPRRPGPGPLPPSKGGPTGLAGPMGGTELSGLNGPTGPADYIANLDLSKGKAHGIGVAGVLRAEGGEFKVTGNDADLILRRASTTVIVQAVRTNHLALQLAAISLLASLDAKLEQLRDVRSNSEDPADYEDLKLRIEEFLAAATSNDEAPVIATTLSLADGLRNWWTKDHASICNKAFNIGLLAGGLGICSLAGAFGTASVVTVGTLIAGKDIPSALEACVKLLKRD